MEPVVNSPGWESLSNGVVKQRNKGVSAQLIRGRLLVRCNEGDSGLSLWGQKHMSMAGRLLHWEARVGACLYEN